MESFNHKLDVEQSFEKLGDKLRSVKRLEQKRLDFDETESPPRNIFEILGDSQHSSIEFFKLSKSTMLSRQLDTSHMHHMQSSCMTGYPEVTYLTNEQYCLFTDGKPVLEEKQIMEMIKATLGVKLPAVSMVRDGIIRSGKSYFVTSIESFAEEEKERNFGWRGANDQPDAEDVAKDSLEAQEKFSQMADEFGFTSVEDFVKNMGTLKEMIDEAVKNNPVPPEKERVPFMLGKRL
jgi:hypothetical protein